MQKIATRIFIYASVAFGVVGLSLVITTPQNSEPNELLMKLFFITILTILVSFALSVANKYLGGGK